MATEPSGERGTSQDSTADPKWKRSSTRRKARKRALDILYEADIRGVDPETLLRTRVERAGAPLSDYATTLIAGVREQQARIDDLLSTYSEGWTLARMPVVDRNILRIAVYELMWREDIPDVVAIDEAVSLSKELSTDDSPNFINGLLGRLQFVKEL